MTRTLTLLTSVWLVAILAGHARADEDEKKDDTAEKKDDAATTPAATPTPATTPTPAPTPAPAPPSPTPVATVPRAESATGGPPLRPAPKSLGLGFGYVFPADVQLINVASARIVFSDTLILEPIFELSFISQGTEVGGMDASDSAFVLAAGTELRYQMWARGRVGLSLVGAAALTFVNNNPEGDDNNTSSLSFGLSWGVGLDLWLWRNWGLSFTMTNPFFSYTSTTEQTPAGDIKNNSTFFGLVWDDTAVRFMLHAYF